MEYNMDTGKRNKLDDIVSRVNRSDISTIKGVISSIIMIMNNPNSTAKDIEEIIQVDPPLTARVLKVANSAYYSPQNKISEIDQAVIWLGFSTIKELILSQKVCEIFEKDEEYEGYSRRALWKHSLAVALMSKMIYRREFGERGENAYVAGLLHNIGIIAVDQFLQNDFKNALKMAKDNQVNLYIAENEIMGFNHQDVAREIILNWELPEEYGMSIGSHHNPEMIEAKYARITDTVFTANYYCQLKKIGYNDASYTEENIYNKCLQRLNLNPLALDLIAKNMQSELLLMEEMGIY
ncbi:HDOD domain-containing protein [candidate division KSB1 bacterium]|nr:HDOD domain-containing protein [candidate division KSB1 bacterium]